MQLDFFQAPGDPFYDRVRQFRSIKISTSEKTNMTPMAKKSPRQHERDNHDFVDEDNSFPSDPDSEFGDSTLLSTKGVSSVISKHSPTSPIRSRVRTEQRSLDDTGYASAITLENLKLGIPLRGTQTARPASAPSTRFVPGMHSKNNAELYTSRKNPVSNSGSRSPQATQSPISRGGESTALVRKLLSRNGSASDVSQNGKSLSPMAVGGSIISKSSILQKGSYELVDIGDDDVLALMRDKNDDKGEIEARDRRAYSDATTRSSITTNKSASDLGLSV